MSRSETFRLNYYVGAMLAQGGNLWFDESKIVFSPTSAIDRALGATDVEIPFVKIQAVEYKGDMMRLFQVTTGDKIHRFHGSRARTAWENLSRTLQEKGMKPINKLGSPFSTSQLASCPQCSGHLEANFIFCPFCGSRIKNN